MSFKIGGDRRRKTFVRFPPSPDRVFTIETYLITKDFDLTVTPMAYAGVPRILERVDLQVERKTLCKKKKRRKTFI